LPSGSVVVQFDVRTSLGAAGDGSTASVPVSWVDPSTADLDALVVGDDVTVIGSVQRRFFRAGGATQSRTEVVVETLVPQRRARTARAAIARAVESLGD
jgi:single-strand DNA-binding protein